MKRLLLTALVCGMCTSVFAQPDTTKKTDTRNTNKWEIIKGNAKISTGNLFVTLPKGTEWDMTIYATGTTKVLSNTSLKTSFTLQPGSYDLEINHIKIMGVPVEKGNKTRLKAGVLHIEDPIAWTLYDSEKQMVLINSLAAETRGLPSGKYKLSINGHDHDIVIEDGKFSDESETEIVAVNPTVYEKWVTSPTKTFMKGKGILNNDFPGATSLLFQTTQITTMPNYLLVDQLSHSINSGPIYLSPGKHRIELNKVVVENVPISENTETRLKTGILFIYFGEGYHVGVGWTVFNKTRSVAYVRSIYSLKLLLPVGEYSIRYPQGEWEEVTIRDRETVEVVIKNP